MIVAGKAQEFVARKYEMGVPPLGRELRHFISHRFRLGLRPQEPELKHTGRVGEVWLVSRMVVSFPGPLRQAAALANELGG